MTVKGTKTGIILLGLISLFLIADDTFAQVKNRTERIYSIVIKSGHVIDPKSGLNEIMDVAIEIPAAQLNTQSEMNLMLH